MVRVVNISAPDLIPPADLYLKVGTVVTAARFRGVFLPHFHLADWLENEMALLSRDVLFVKEIFKFWVETKDDVKIAVGFSMDRIDRAGYRDALSQDLESAGIIYVIPETLIALRSNCSSRLIRPGDRPRLPQHKHQRKTDPDNQKYYDRAFHAVKKKLAR
jgi:hypothetical protein